MAEVAEIAGVAGVSGKLHAGEERTGTLSRYGADVQVPLSPSSTEWIFQTMDDDLQSEGWVIVGLVGTDGSKIKPRPLSGRRAGLTAVKCDGAGRAVYAVYDTCLDRSPTAHRAELWAFAHALRRSA